MPDTDTGDLLAEHEQAGGTDPDPTPVRPGDPDYVEPYAHAPPIRHDDGGER